MGECRFGLAIVIREEAWNQESALAFEAEGHSAELPEDAGPYRRVPPPRYR